MASKFDTLINYTFHERRMAKYKQKERFNVYSIIISASLR